jgi:hypothetical protein
MWFVTLQNSISLSPNKNLHALKSPECLQGCAGGMYNWDPFHHHALGEGTPTVLFSDLLGVYVYKERTIQMKL